MDRARELFAASAPRVPQAHLFHTGQGAHLLVADGSRVYTVDDPALASLRAALADPGRMDDELARLGLTGDPFVADAPPDAAELPVRALSLAVAQKCNLGCTYCYAQEGSFGGAPKSMPLSTAQAAVDFLLAGAGAGERVHLTFLGGEPLASRAVLRETTERAARQAAEKGVRISFAVTTNGTLLTPEDGELFERHGFAVTVSLDGVGAAHDRLRPWKGGGGSYDRILERVAPLLAMQRRMQVSARVTVTPRNLDLRETLDELLGLGFHSVGFSPLLSSPSGRDEMTEPALAALLDGMVECGEEFERRVAAGERYAFLNLVNALREIHRGTHRPYPCGAGAGYLGVSADGELAACHRFVGDAAGALGDLAGGIDPDRRAAWLAERHVHRQEPCRSCWARYLCGGGCHHEVIHRGRPACDYIRGWLHYCLQAYVRLLEVRPDYFGLSPARSS